MGSYNETVLWSAESGGTGTITLSAHPSAYDYMRISYGTPAIPRTATTSFPNLGAMWTVELPTTSNYLSLYSNFYGGCSTASANTMYRAAALFSGTTGSSWTQVFNRYGSVNSSNKEVVVNAAWNKIYTVVGVKTGDTGYFHRDLLYDRDRDGSTVTLKRHPSGYRRIGISFNLPYSSISSVNRSMESYCEYPYSFLSTYNNGYAMFQHPFFSAPFSGSQRYNGVSLYSGVSGTSWGIKWSMNFSETSNAGTGVTNGHVITRIVGIDRK